MPHRSPHSAEIRRLEEDARREKNWKRWGPYLSERQWGTVREDYSENGDCWNHFPHDHARSRAYRWGEDGLMGISDRECRLCFSVALWNGRDPILKERLFGLNGHEGNHGEDVKESYFYLDSTPTHSYLKALYKYPQKAFPYEELVHANAERGRKLPELELADTGAFDEGRYFDVFAEYAKADPDDILICLTAVNRGPEAATLHLLPQLWFRNTWSWGSDKEICETKPRLEARGEDLVSVDHSELGAFEFHLGHGPGGLPPKLLFTDNDTNEVRFAGQASHTGHFKDAFHERVVNGRAEAVRPEPFGTKMAGWYELRLEAGAEASVHLRLRSRNAGGSSAPSLLGMDFEAAVAARRREADEFFRLRIPASLDLEEKRAMRQAFAGLLWSKQFYHYVVKDWIAGDPHQPEPPASRRFGRNHDWPHLYNRDVISMPDKWEYPWYAAWDLAFHMIPFAQIDAAFAKEQLLTFLREWYMHPNGQLPAYEFAFGDVNPPVHGWACWRVYKMSAPKGFRDTLFLARVFQKLLINFTWWVNRKDAEGNHIFGGGFLGMDNIGLFDRSKPLKSGRSLEQADGTAWMAFFSTNMIAMALELAITHSEYEDTASKFFEHFVAITNAMNQYSGGGLWDETDGFYYDRLSIENQTIKLKVRSMVGLVPLFACEVLEVETLAKVPGFRKRMDWFLRHEKSLSRHVLTDDRADGPGGKGFLLALLNRERLTRVLRYVLDEKEFLSPYGIRSLSKAHSEPYTLNLDGDLLSVKYAPGDSDTNLFGGNSNWRGPIWFPLNYLIVEALERYHFFFGESLKVECPVGSGRFMNLAEVAREIEGRLARLFLPDESGARPCHGGEKAWATDPAWKDLLLFHEYFDGDTGRGLGASHQTGWTALVSRSLERIGKRRMEKT